MKKNMLSIIILALLVVNIGMNAFMLFSVLTTNSQTAKLISDIAAALELESSGGNGGGFSSGASGNVDVSNVATFGFIGDDKLIINLKPGSDGKSHLMVVEVVFSVNTSHADYATYGTSETLNGYKELIKSKVNEVLSSYTMEELQDGNSNYLTEAKEKILEEVQDGLYNGSSFIYDVTFSSILYQ